MVEYNYITGSPSNVVEHLTRSFAQFSRHYSILKVGITGRKPEIRYNEHLRNYDWDKMVVKYRTTSERYVNLLEDYFIEQNSEFVNEWVGTSHLSKNWYNYLYILLGN